MHNEAQARIKINKLLEAAGWQFENSDKGKVNIQLEPGVDYSALGDDFEHKKVKYCEKIKGCKIDKSCVDEEVARDFVLAKLVNELGYKPEDIQLEKDYDIGRPKVNKPRIDIIVRDIKGDAFLCIELKSPQDYEKDKDDAYKKTVSYFGYSLCC